MAQEMACGEVRLAEGGCRQRQAPSGKQHGWKAAAPRRARAVGQLGFAGAGVEAWAPWLSSWLADGRELASGMGRGGPEWERVVLRSGGHALIAPPAAPGTNAMGHRRTRELCRGLLRCREPREPWEPFRGSGSHPNFYLRPPNPEATPRPPHCSI